MTKKYELLKDDPIEIFDNTLYLDDCESSESHDAFVLQIAAILGVG